MRISRGTGPADELRVFIRSGTSIDEILRKEESRSKSSSLSKKEMGDLIVDENEDEDRNGGKGGGEKMSKDNDTQLDNVLGAVRELTSTVNTAARNEEDIAQNSLVGKDDNTMDTINNVKSDLSGIVKMVGRIRDTTRGDIAEELEENRGGSEDR